MIIVIIVIFAIILAFGSIIAAILMMSKTKKDFENQEEIYVRAEVIKTDSSIQSMTGANMKKVYDHTGYFIMLRSDQNETIVVTCKKKMYLSLLPGFYGDLVYKGTRLISFNRLKEHEEARLLQRLEEGYFFQNKGIKQNPLKFYCDSPDLGVHIPADQPIDCDVNEVIKYVNRMFENQTENFFGLDNGTMEVQFFHDGVSQNVLVDIPAMQINGTYQTMLKGINQVKTIVRTFYHGDDIFKLANFEFVSID